MSGKIDACSTKERIMTKRLLCLLAIAALAGCGVETATTAATGAAIKKQEVEQGKKTMEHAQQQLDQALQQTQKRADEDAQR